MQFCCFSLDLWSVNNKDDQIQMDTKKLSRNEEAKHVLIRFKEPEDSRIVRYYPKNIILLSVVSMYCWHNLQFIQLNMLSFYCLN